MLVILKNGTGVDMNIRVHTGDLVNVKNGATLVVNCEHERFPYYATLKSTGIEVGVHETFALVEIPETTQEVETAVEESKAEEPKVEEQKAEQPKEKVEPVKKAKTTAKTEKQPKAEEVAELKKVEETADTVTLEMPDKEQVEVNKAELVNETVEETQPETTLAD